MSPVAQGIAGATRVCPHCRATILESEAVCPSCKHHLRAGQGTAGAARPVRDTFSPFTVEGTVRHPGDSDPWEYSVVVTVRDARGKEISRHVAGIGALRGGEVRSFTCDVSVHKAR
jgi:hypothetical protein